MPNTSVQSVLKAADSASYRARQRGRNKIHVFDAKDGLDERHGRLHWVQKVRRALAEDRFVLYGQKIEALHPNGSGLHEILLRMIGDQGEPLAPGLFIPIAESYNLAPLIDRWHLTDLPLPRASRAVDLAAVLDSGAGKSSGGGLRVAGCHPSPLDALRAAVLEADPADRIVVFGSFHTVGGVLKDGVPRLAARHLAN